MVDCPFAERNSAAESQRLLLVQAVPTSISFSVLLGETAMQNEIDDISQRGHDGSGDRPSAIVSTPQSSAEGEQRACGLAHGDRLFLACVAAALVVILGLRAWRQVARSVETVEIRHLLDHEFTYQLDINTASWVEWMQLEGIGETTARRIVADREENGPFSSITDIQRVKGIGPKTFAANRKHLLCSTCPETE